MTNKPKITVTPDDGSGINMIGNESYWFEEAEEGSALYLAIERIAELEAERDQLREQNAELEAHVEKIRSWDSCQSLTPHQRWERIHHELGAIRAISLDRIRAEAKAEALRELRHRDLESDEEHGTMLSLCIRMEGEYRQQAEEGE